MAGDWIKMRTTLAAERAVMLICDRTGLDEFQVIGRLHAIWSWAGEHTVTGDVRGVTLATIDRVTRCAGFADAMTAAEWLESLPEGGVRFPRFKKHNGKSAKRRALDAVRSAKYRHNKSRSASRRASRDNVTNHAPREEKRREDITKGKTLSNRAFVPPTVDEVRAYCTERKNNIDPQVFVDHYTSNGWKVGGKAPMKDWKASVRTWEQNRDRFPKQRRLIDAGPGQTYQPGGPDEQF